MNLQQWTGVPRPERTIIDGRYARLEPLNLARHGDNLWDASRAPGAAERFRYLFEEPPSTLAEVENWIGKATASSDPLFSAVIDKATGRAEGRQALMRIEPVHGVIEIGSILWGPAISRTRIATEAFYLAASHVFDTLGYRRFEWKCNNLNEPSKRAAMRFGFTFEGIFRQHMVVKHMNRDTAWFAMTDGDWPRLKAGYETWLQPANFDSAGQQKAKLTF